MDEQGQIDFVCVSYYHEDGYVWSLLRTYNVRDWILLIIIDSPNEYNYWDTANIIGVYVLLHIMAHTHSVIHNGKASS
jgi:hypothetical protein